MHADLQCPNHHPSRQTAAPDPAHYAMLVMSHALRANVMGQQLVKLMESM